MRLRYAVALALLAWAVSTGAWLAGIAWDSGALMLVALVGLIAAMFMPYMADRL